MASPTNPPGASAAKLTDPNDDLTDADTDGPVNGPAYVDVTELSLSLTESDLLAAFVLAGDPPAELDALYTTVGYYLLIDTVGSDFYEYTVDLSSLDDWSPSLFDVEEAFNYGGDRFPGSATTDGELVLIRVSLDALGAPATFRVRGLVQYENYPDPNGDPFTSTTAEDSIPNDESMWVTLSH